MISYKELLTTPEYWTTRIQLDLYKMMETYMESNNLSRADLANKLGVTKGYISQVLNGDFDHRLSKLVELSMAIGMIPQIRYIPMDKVFSKETSVELCVDSISETNALFKQQYKSFDNMIGHNFSTIENDTVYKKDLKITKAA